MSSAWLMITSPRSAAMTIASYITFDERTPRPSSLRKRISSGSVRRWSSVWPSKSFVMDTHWLTPHRPTSSACAITLRAMAALEHTGFVFAMQLTNV